MNPLRLLVAAAIAVLAAWSLPVGAASALDAPVGASPTATTGSAAAPVGPALSRTDLEGWLDGYMRAGMASSGVPGAVVVVVKNGKVLFGKGYGFADVAQRRPVNPQTTLFRVGSISKLFTWTAAMQLFEQGKLDLDADVNRYLDFTIPNNGGRPVTMRALMTHTAGFEDARRGTAVQDPAKLVPLAVTMKRDLPARVYPDGRTAAYSNYGTALAGYIVQRVSGVPFDDYVERHILKPLGMKGSTFSQSLPAELAQNLAQGYVSAQSTPGAFEWINWTPAGGLSATGGDMARFMVAHLQNGALGNARILSTSTAQTMHDTPHVTIPGLQRMMLGFFERDVNGRDLIGHDGDTVLFHSLMALYLRDGVGLFVSFNSPGVGGTGLTLRQQLLADFSDRYFPLPFRVTSSVPLETARAHAQLFADNYVNSRSNSTSFMAIKKLFFPVRVMADAQGNIAVNGLRSTSGQPVWFRETKPYYWTEIGGSQRLAAIVAEGRIVRFGIDMLSPAMVFDAVPWWRSPTWLMPASVFSVLMIAIWLVAGPIEWVARRRFGAAVRNSAEIQTERLTRVAAAFVLIAIGCWLWVFSQVLDPIRSYMLSQHDGAILAIEGLTVLALPTLMILAARLTLLRFRARTRWAACPAIALTIAAALLLYVSLAYQLINFSLAS